LLHADVLRVVCTQLLASPNAGAQQQESQPTVADSLIVHTSESGEAINDQFDQKTLNTNNTVVPQSDTEWHTVKEVIKRRKFRGKIQFLVRWESDNSQTWVDRRDITDAAIQQFIAQRNQRRRRRRH
jgi:hypothetical protein